MELHTQIEIEIMKRWAEYCTALKNNATYSDKSFFTKEVKNYIKRIDWSIEHLDNVIELCKKINFYYINKNNCDLHAKTYGGGYSVNQKSLLQNLRNNINNHIILRKKILNGNQKLLF